jgi:hypothetical protein
MTEGTKVNFKRSKSAVKDVLNDKALNDAARKLHSDYEVKLAELKTAGKNVQQMLAKSGAGLKYDSIINIDDNGDIVAGDLYKTAVDYQEVVLRIAELPYDHEYGVSGAKNRFYALLKDEKLKDALDVFSEGGYYLGRALKALDDSNRDKLQSTLKKANQHFSGYKAQDIIDIYNTIDAFYKIYGQILDMDDRTPSEKTETISGYAEEVLTQLQSGNIDVIKKVASDGANFVGELYEQGTSLFGDQINKAIGAMSYSLLGFSNFLYESFTSEDQKEIDKTIKEDRAEQKIAGEVYEEAHSTDVISADDQNSVTLQNYKKEIPVTAVKLTDRSYSTSLHKDFQAQAANFIENQKGVCFLGAGRMQSFVVQNCKAKLIHDKNEDCVALEKAADIALQNCDAIYQMETKHDNILNEFIIYSTSEYVDITKDNIVYLGAGEKVAQQNYFSAEVTVENLLIGEAPSLGDDTNGLVLAN